MPAQITTKNGNRYEVAAFIDKFGEVHEVDTVKFVQWLPPLNGLKKDVRTIDLQQRIHEVDSAIAANRDKLTDWELGFVADMVNRSRTYGSKLEISPKQAEQIEKIWEKLQKEVVNG